MSDASHSPAAAADHPAPDQIADDPWGWWRQQMPISRRWAYFDHGAVAPLPQPTVDRIAAFTRQASCEGDTVWPEWSQEMETMRQRVAEWIGAASAEVAFVPNTTFGINMVAEGWPWRAGDNVVIPAGEFPSNHFPWQNQESRGVELRVVGQPGGPVDLNAIAAAIDGSTRLVAASWVGYASGFRLDVDKLVEIAHHRGAAVFLDAIQGLGVFPLNVKQTPVDFLAADGHKWMLGPEGAGILYIKREFLDRLRCGVVGWNSVRGGQQFGKAEFRLRDEAARYEGGSANIIGLLALHRSLQIFWEIERATGREGIGVRVLELVDAAEQRLTAAGARVSLPRQRENRSGIVLFDVPGQPPAAVRAACLEAGIVVSCRGGGVRASLHAYNTFEEIERLAGVVAELALGGKRASET
ncbi:MAG: aminotransferase class V-fold PLP-dependent enzyme [Pirellulaceae bacterium]